MNCISRFNMVTTPNVALIHINRIAAVAKKPIIHTILSINKAHNKAHNYFNHIVSPYYDNYKA